MSATGQTSELAGSLGDPSQQSTESFVVAREPVTKVDRWVDTSSDWMSSILVKETRQAIKSRQFFITLISLVLAAIVCAFVSLAPGRDGYNEATLGSDMMCGFLWILGVPLVLIIPFTTYRSLSREFEDGTIGMVLITTMKPWQIVAGKLGSAMLQMLLYLSVLAPCITFCYLLRGLGVEQIVVALCGAATICFGLNCLALGMASLSSNRRFTALMSVALIGGQLIVGWIWAFSAWGICYEGADLNMPIIRVVLFGGLFFVVSTGLLLFVCAAAQLSFPTSNRSTLIRICVLLQVVLFLSWFVGMCNCVGVQNEGFAVASAFSHSYLLLVGAMMVACASGLSERVRRSLPTTFAGRSVWSLLMPGPGRAWLFMAGLGIGLSIVFALIAIFSEYVTGYDSTMMAGFGTGPTFSALDLEMSLATIYANLVYFLFYLSIMFLFMRFYFRVRKDRTPFVVEAGLLTAIMIALITIGSYTMDSYLRSIRGWGRGLSVHLFNWYEIQYEIGSKGISSGGAQVMLMSVFTLALVAVSGVIAVKELQETATSIPERNLLDDQENARQTQLKTYDDETIDEIFAAKRPGQDS